MQKIFIKLSITVCLIFGAFFIIDNIIDKKLPPRRFEHTTTITVVDSKGNIHAEETAYSNDRYLGDVIDEFNKGTYEGLNFELEGWSIGRTVKSINGIETSWTNDYFAISSPTNKWCVGYEGDFNGPDNYCQKGIDGLDMEEKDEEFVFTFTYIEDESI